jgi:hypothetical protein
MRLSGPLIAKFQQAHLEEFGEAISTEAAEAELLGLAELIEITGNTRHAIDEDTEDGEENATKAIYSTSN